MDIKEEEATCVKMHRGVTDSRNHEWWAQQNPRRKQGMVSVEAQEAESGQIIKDLGNSAQDLRSDF